MLPGPCVFACSCWAQAEVGAKTVGRAHELLAKSLDHVETEDAHLLDCGREPIPRHKGGPANARFAPDGSETN